MMGLRTLLCHLKPDIIHFIRNILLSYRRLIWVVEKDFFFLMIGKWAFFPTNQSPDESRDLLDFHGLGYPPYLSITSLKWSGFLPMASVLLWGRIFGVSSALSFSFISRNLHNISQIMTFYWWHLFHCKKTIGSCILAMNYWNKVNGPIEYKSDIQVRCSIAVYWICQTWCTQCTWNIIAMYCTPLHYPLQ